MTTVKDLFTPFYAPIEQGVLQNDAHPSYDIWSLGIITYTLMARKEPYSQEDVSIRIKAMFDS